MSVERGGPPPPLTRTIQLGGILCRPGGISNGGTSFSDQKKTRTERGKGEDDDHDKLTCMPFPLRDAPRIVNRTPTGDRLTAFWHSRTSAFHEYSRLSEVSNRRSKGIQEIPKAHIICTATVICQCLSGDKSLKLAPDNQWLLATNTHDTRHFTDP